MGCKSLFVNLGGSYTAPNGMLQTAAALSATAQVVKDNLGNSSILNLSTTLLNIGSGTITNNGILTIKGDGGNIQSWRDSSNAEKMYLSNSGVLYSRFFKDSGNGYFEASTAGAFQIDSRAKVNSPADGVIRLTNYGASGFTRLIFGLNDTTGASLVKNGTALQVKDGDGSNFTTIEPLQILTRAPGGGTAKKIKFGERIAVTEAALTALGIDSQWLVEIEAANYYILGGSSQFS